MCMYTKEAPTLMACPHRVSPHNHMTDENSCPQTRWGIYQHLHLGLPQAATGSQIKVTAFLQRRATGMPGKVVYQVSNEKKILRFSP